MVGEPEILVDDDAEVSRMNRFSNWNILKVVLELILVFANMYAIILSVSRIPGIDLSHAQNCHGYWEILVLVLY